MNPAEETLTLVVFAFYLSSSLGDTHRQLCIDPMELQHSNLHIK